LLALPYGLSEMIPTDMKYGTDVPSPRTVWCSPRIGSPTTYEVTIPPVTNRVTIPPVTKVASVAAGATVVSPAFSPA
jgi:hypothetical protein